MKPVTVTSGSRLHFGLTRVGASRHDRLGGLGVMVQQPCTQLGISAASRFAIRGSPRMKAFSAAWLDHVEAGRPGIRIELRQAPPAHAGLGSGTQLAQSVAAGINRFLNLPQPDVVDVARVLDRGQRSLVGSLGFATGGLVIDRPSGVSSQGPARSRSMVRNFPGEYVVLPGQWRVVIVQHCGVNQTFGEREKLVFESLRPDFEAALRLERLIEQEIVPAARTGDFEGFSESVFEYGLLSGNYYAGIQGGPYNGPFVTDVINCLRAANIRGVGQSSWGPAVFAWCRDPQQADSVLNHMRIRFGTRANFSVSAVRNQPADLIVE